MNKIAPAGSPPRYLQILAALRARVEAGVYPLETSLPTESELCDEFEASRYTVREALRRLVDQGMVHRRQGSGSVVVAREPQARYVHSLSSLDGLFQFALDTHYDVISTEAVELTAARARQVGGETGSVWSLVRGIRRTHARGDVICFTHSYIPKRLARFVPGLPGCVGPSMRISRNLRAKRSSRRIRKSAANEWTGRSRAISSASRATWRSVRCAAIPPPAAR